jgi:hypothetical protein
MDADGVAAPDDGGQVVRLVHVVHDEREVDLSLFEQSPYFVKSFGSDHYRPFILDVIFRQLQHKKAFFCVMFNLMPLRHAAGPGIPG